MYKYKNNIDKLKPCPFCGKKIEKFDLSNDLPNPRVRIYHFCQLNGEKEVFTIEIQTNWQKSEKECIKIWNKRSEFFNNSKVNEFEIAMNNEEELYKYEYIC